MNPKKIHGICTLIEITLFLLIIWIQETKIRIAVFILFICIAIVKQIIRKKFGITIFNDDKH